MTSLDERREYLFRLGPALEAALTRRLRDPRDLALALLLTNICLTTLPGAVLVLLTRSHIVGALYCALNSALYLEPFLLALHFGTHRPVFRAARANLLAPVLLAPLFGLPPGLYRAHHVHMHHAEENAAARDLTSTEAFQRDSPWHFALYWLRFTALTWLELPWYLARTRGARAGAACAAKIAAAAAGYAAATWACPTGALWVLWVPAGIASVALAFGNWCQHIFVRPGHDGAPVDITLSITDARSNLRNFNDGYHAEHHARPGAHWSELPALFAAAPPEERIVFRETSFFDVGLCVMRGDYATLARKFVPSAARPAVTQRHIEALLRARLRPCARKRHIAAAVDLQKRL